jgi:hypothetical protein
MLFFWGKSKTTSGILSTRDKPSNHPTLLTFQLFFTAMQHLYSPFVSRFVAFVFLTVLPRFADAQAPQFPTESGDFVNKLGEFMTASKRPDMEEAFSVFKSRYKSGLLPEARMQRVSQVANRMAELKLAAFPYFKNYVNAVSAVVVLPDSTVFGQWHGNLESVLAAAQNGKNKPISAYLEFSADFMEQRALKVGEGGSATWRMRGGQYEFGVVDSSKQSFIRCRDVDLVAIRKQDSIVIRRTSGLFFPMANRWQGNGGRVTWQAVGLDSTVYATLGGYALDVNKSIFKCDTALLQYPLYFPTGPVAGTLEHSVTVGSRDSAAQYPKFVSFAKTLEINKIGEGIEYRGGFRLWGNVLYGYGTWNQPAHLEVFDKKRRKVFEGNSELFLIRREQSIASEGTDAKLLMDDGTEISHPGANFRLEVKKSSIVLQRGNEGAQRNPFYSTFYNMNLDAERIAYHFNADSIEIGAQVPGRKGVRQTVGFESNKLYEPSTMIRIQNIAEKNPISVLYVLALATPKDSLDRYVVSDNAYAAALNPKWDRSSIQTLLAQLVAEGFINYYFDRQQIVLRDKLIHYALASAGKADYDAINIQSTSNESNATFDLKTKQTTINEVRRLELSQRQHVAMSPSDEKLVLLKNRDMKLTGRLFAGYALFEGRNMDFNYDKFDITFDSVKNLDFYLPYGEKDPNTGLRKANAMNSTVEYVSGVLLVDAPNNKSGREDLDMFPSLQSKKNSYVYYERPETQGGAYRRDSFFFKLDPFSLNRVDDYEVEQIQFKGEMRPALIFPPFRETIVVRPEDKSFGYVHRTPKEGYPTYAAKGGYVGTLDLSNKGFFGKGKVSYLTADIESEDLIFKPKQMTGTARKFFMTEDRAGAVKVPEARGQDVKVNWLPFRDSMYVESKAKDFGIFKTEGYAHKGILILTPTGLKANGVFDWAGGRLQSRLIAYGPFQASADTANMQIKAIGGAEGIALESKNVDADLDFDAKTGKFKANSASANTTLPFNQYRTSMNEFDWDMAAQTILFKADPNKPGVFESTDPDRDSLRYTGTSAFYDMKTNRLVIGGVEVIKSADAFIYPDSARIEITAGGGMKQLQNARIVADTVSKYHVITRATVDVLGKKDYKAKGYYQYNIPGYEQEVFFDNIIGERVGGGSRNNKNLLTSASGPIKEDANFRMDAKVLFKGEVQLEANKPNLRFDGFAKLDADKLPNDNYFYVNSVVDKNNPIIRIKNSKNEADDPLITGVYLSRETGECYPRFLQPAYSRMDRALLNAQGVFKYDAPTDRFIFGDSATIIGNAPRGARLTFDNRVGSVLAEGKIGLGSGLEYMKVKAAGRLRTDFNVTDSTGFVVNGEVMSGMEIVLPAKLQELFLNSLRAATYEAPTAIYTAQSAFYQQVLPEFVSDPKLDPTTQADLKNNLILLPKADDKFTFLLGRHQIEWNGEYSSFLSSDDKMPLISVGGEQINKVLTTYVEYRMPGNEDDRFYLYISVTPELWYFFGYQAGALNVASSDTKFNELLFSMKPKDLQFKMPDGETYEVIASNPNVANAFVNRVKEGRRKK